MAAPSTDDKDPPVSPRSPQHGILRPPQRASSQEMRDSSPEPAGLANPVPLKRISSSSSVTVLSHECLPSYSIERFYMLSELQHHAPNTVFLDEVRAGPQQPPQLAEDDPEKTWPRYSVVYVLWEPTMTRDPQQFLETMVQPLLATVERFARVVPSPVEEFDVTTVASSKSTLSATSSASSSSSSKRVVTEERLGAKPKESSAGTTQEPASAPPPANSSNQNSLETSVYVVVDRLVPDRQTEDDALFEKEEEILQQLIRLAAVQFRSQCEGVSAYLSDHERAAPGLEACLNAVSVGGPDRRRYGQRVESETNTTTATTRTSPRSYMGLIATSSRALLGVQAREHAEPDAVQGVRQSATAAEWNGRGNLDTFARRAHEQWCRDRAVPNSLTRTLDPGKGTLSLTRRLRFKAGYDDDGTFDEGAMDQALQSLCQNFVIVAIMIGYFVFHYGKDVAQSSFFLGTTEDDTCESS